MQQQVNLVWSGGYHSAAILTNPCLPFLICWSAAVEISIAPTDQQRYQSTSRR